MGRGLGDEGSSKTEKGLMDMDNSVGRGVGGGRRSKRKKRKWKNTIKI